MTEKTFESTFKKLTKGNIEDVDSVNAYMRQVYNYMTIGLGISGLVAYIVSVIPALSNLILHTPLLWVVIFAPLAMIFFFSKSLYNASPGAAQTWFWIFSVLEGLMLSIMFLHYTGESVIGVFFITSAMFAALSIYGLTTKRDMSSWGKFLFIAVIGLIAVMLINLFVGSAQFGLLISIGAVLVFSALIAYDTQRIRDDFIMYGGNESTAVQGALSLYLDFLNIFIHLLSIFGIKVND